MTIRPVLWTRVLNSAGLVCLATSLLLLPAGVRSIRAADEAERPIRVDPTPVASESAISGNPPAAPLKRAGEADQIPRPGSADRKAQAGVIVLNTRGYNYGPTTPGEQNPAAAGLESKQR